MGWLAKLFGQSVFDPTTRVIARFEGKAEGDHFPVGVGFSSTTDHEDLWQYLDRIAGPEGVSAGDAIRSENIPEMINWLGASQPDPCARALVRLLFDSQTKGFDYWSEGWINMFWSPGVPPKSV